MKSPTTCASASHAGASGADAHAGSVSPTESQRHPISSKSSLQGTGDAPARLQSDRSDRDRDLDLVRRQARSIDHRVCLGSDEALSQEAAQVALAEDR